MAKIGVIGLGYVGLPLALLSARKGHDVYGIDLSDKKVDLINKGIDPITDHYVASNIAGTTLKATTDFSLTSDCDFVLICVPTPVKEDYTPDLGPLKGALQACAPYLKDGAVVIVESTVNPGVCDEIVIPLLEELTSRKVNEDFYVVHCPERINPGDPQWSVENIPRVVGGSSEAATLAATEFYHSIITAPIKPMQSLKEAEACKVVENSFRDINIAFVNELAMSFTKLGINIKNVIEGASTKPFAFIPHFPSIGVGGHCIPVDPYYLIEYARDAGFDHKFLSLARSINNSMPQFTFEQLVSGLRDAGIEVEGTKVALLGLSYKPNVADDRESPSHAIRVIMEKAGMDVVSFDPHMVDKSDVATIEEALNGAEAILMATNHKEFLDYDFLSTSAKVFVDGRNAFEPEYFRNSMIYRGIGV